MPNITKHNNVMKLYHFQLIDLHNDLRDTRITLYIFMSPVGTECL